MFKKVLSSIMGALGYVSVEELTKKDEVIAEVRLVLGAAHEYLQITGTYKDERTAPLLKQVTNALDPAGVVIHREWCNIPASNLYKRITEMKTKWLIENNGYKTGGYVLYQGDRICISYGSAIRWLSDKEMFKIMHFSSNFSPDTRIGHRRKTDPL